MDADGNPIPKKKRKKKKGSRRQFFTVDLKLFRNVEEMKGDKIGEKGGVALGREVSISEFSSDELRRRGHHF